MIALYGVSAWRGKHAVGCGEIGSCEVECKGSVSFSHMCTAISSSVISEVVNRCVQRDEIRNVPLIFVKVTFLHTERE
jgi:hypothetical protein